MVSWDETAGTYDTNVDDGRSYISVISEVTDEQTCLGAAKKNMGEARMDIVSSEMAYLGYYQSESYGLTWKVSLFFRTVFSCLADFSVRNSIGAAAVFSPMFQRGHGSTPSVNQGGRAVLLHFGH